MKRIAHIEENLIVNVSLAEDDEPLAPGTMLESEALAAGFTYRSAPRDEIAQRRAQMASILDALPVAVQASLWPTRIAVEQALDRGRLDIARQLVQDTQVPAELEDAKNSILALFPV